MMKIFLSKEYAQFDEVLEEFKKKLPKEFFKEDFDNKEV